MVPDDTTACSLGRYVVISQRDFEYNSQEILTHEDAHRRFGHLFDSLFLNLCQVVLWFDPFIWLIRRDMREIHEFQADRYVLGQESSVAPIRCSLFASASARNCSLRQRDFTETVR